MTPSKHANRAGQQASSKRPAPGSSSVNKVILFRAKRGSGSSSTTANAAEQHNNQAACSTSNAAGTILSSSRGRKQLFETKNNSNNKDVVDSHEGRGSGALKPRNAASKQQAKPFIAVEQSIDGGSGGHHQQGANNLVDASVASSNTSTSVIPRTRAQARLLASATAIKQQQPSAVKVASSNAFGSASKSTRSRKAAAAADEEPRARQSGYTTPSRGTGGGGRQPRGGNFVSKEDSTTSKLRNATPLRSGAGRNVIDLSSVSVTNEAGGNGRGRAALTKPSTPFKHGGHGHSGSVSSMASSTCSNAAPGTPSSSSSSSTASNLRRAEQERARQEKLLLSEDKRKKADEKKKDMLELRAARLKEERDARMEKIRENKLALKRQNEAKNREVLCSASKPVIKPAAQLTSSRVNARRRAALESVIAQPVLDLSESKPKTRAARNAANTRAAQKAAAAAASDSLVSFAKKETAAAAAAAKKESSTVKNSRNKKATAAGGKGGKSGTASSSSSASAASSATTTSGGKRKLFAEDDDDDDVEDERDGGGSGANQKKKMPPPIPSTKPVATLSPIAKVAGADGQLPDGINTRLNETFTTEAVLQETIQPPSGPSGVKEKVTASKKCTTITATFSAGSSSSSSTTTTATTATMTRFQATAAANWPGQVIYSDLRDNPTSVYNMQTGWFFSSKSTLEASGATPAHSTFVAEVAASASTSDQVTFAVPAIPPEGGRVGTPKSNKAGNNTDPKQNDNGSTTTNSSPFNMAKKLLTPKGSGGSGGGGSGGGGGKKGSGSGKNKAELCTQYEMTPPPAVEPADNYDISRYIDSDDEEEQQRHEEAASGKRIPAWATGKSFLSALHKQFRQSYSELAAQTERLFTASLLPVPLDEMGLPVRNRYAVRSSSVNWKSAEAIRSATAAGAAKGKK